MFLNLLYRQTVFGFALHLDPPIANTSKLSSVIGGCVIDWELNLKIFAGTDPPDKTDYPAHAKRAKAINDKQSPTVVKIFRGNNRTPALKWLLLGK